MNGEHSAIYRGRESENDQLFVTPGNNRALLGDRFIYASDDFRVPGRNQPFLAFSVAGRKQLTLVRSEAKSQLLDLKCGRAPGTLILPQDSYQE